MVWKTITIEREALYEQVWSTPMSRLASEYQMSDVGLAKICKKMQIPRPGRGYWAKVQNGAKVKRQPLRKLTKNGESRVMIQRRVNEVEVEQEANPIILAANNLPKLTVDPSFENAPRIIAQNRGFLEKAKPDENGILHLRQKNGLAIRVSQAQAERALQVVAAVIQGLGQLGHAVKVVEEDDKKQTCAIIGDQSVRFHIEEKCKREDHVWTESELKLKEKADKASLMDRMSFHFDLMHVPKWDYHPSGKLTFQIEDYSWNGKQHTWSDGKTQRLEDCINAIVKRVVSIAEEKKARELERQREREEAQRRWERQQRLQELQEAEQEKIDAFVHQSEQWHKSHKLKAYLQAVEAQYEGISPTPEQQAWLKWAKDYADHINPLATSEYKEPALED